MKIKPNYKLREIAGENMVVNQGVANVNMTRIISLNKSASRLYKALSDKEFTIEDAAGVLMELYGIGEDQALSDAQRWVDGLRECGILADE